MATEMRVQDMEASRYLLSLATRIAEVYVAHTEAVAAMVMGSVALGLCDNYSDIDMAFYYAELPSEEALEAARKQLGGSERVWTIGDREEGAFIEAFRLHGVECQLVHETTDSLAQQFATVQEKLEVDSPLQKALSGMLDGVALHGEAVIGEWKARAADYPDALARAMVEKHLDFFPIWSAYEWLAPRDITLWLYQTLVESAQNLVCILAGLNRLYFSTFQFKRAHRFLAKMTIAPPDCAARLDHLFQTEPAEAVRLLHDLVRETIGLVERHLPEVDTTTARRRLERKYEPWTPDVFPPL